MKDAADLQPILYIVDDDLTMREWLSFALKHKGYYAQAFGTAADFLQVRKPEHPGVGIFDFNLPGMSGLELHGELLRRHDPLPIIMISGEGDIPAAVTSLKRGAVDWLVKPFPPEQLLESVEKALQADRQAREQADRARLASQRMERLTPREREVMALLLAGYLNKNIADELKLSERTVEYHRSNLMTKLEVHSLPELISVIYELRPYAPPEVSL